MITSSTLTVSVARDGGSFGVVEVQWNASVTGISHLYMSLITSLMLTFTGLSLLHLSTGMICIDYIRCIDGNWEATVSLV